jgi:hypothetical protein
MIDYATILFTKYPDSRWTLNGDDYEGLTWLSDTPKPTKAILDNLWDEVIAELQAEKIAKATQRQALLTRLGITEDEARLLLG